jgi:predicted DNA-binding transcriptional regulator AlpA
MTAANPDLMSLSETAAYLGWSPSTLYNRRYRGDDLPPAYRLGGRVVFRRSEVDAWIDAHADDRPAA